MPTTTIKKKFPPATPEQKEANKLAIELAERQAEEIQRRRGITEGLSSERKKLIREQLRLKAEGIKTTEAAQRSLEKSLQAQGIESEKKELRDLLRKKTLAQLKGEEGVTPKQSARLKQLESKFTGRTQKLQDLQSRLKEKAFRATTDEGLRPSAKLTALSEEELGRQTRRIGREAETTRLGTEMDIPMQNLRKFEGQREFAEGYGQREEMGDIEAQLALARGGAAALGGGGTQRAGARPQAQIPTGTSFKNITQQMKQQRMKGATQSTFIEPPSRETGAKQGAMTGAVSGATIGSQIGGGWGMLIGGIIGGIAGGIYGYNM